MPKYNPVDFDIKLDKSEEKGFKAVLNSYSGNCKKRNREFLLGQKEAYLLFKGDCYYCGQSPSNIKMPEYVAKNEIPAPFIYNGIDRKDNTREYDIDNCVSCCKTCNFFKHTMSDAEFLSLISRIFFNRVSKKEHQQFGEVFEKLTIANIKLYNLCDRKAEAAKNPGKYTQEQLAKMASDDIELCKERARCKSEINKFFAAKMAVEETKNYGST